MSELRLIDFVKDDEYTKFKGQAERSAFLGIPLSELSRDDLLFVIGFQENANHEQEESHKRTESFLHDAWGAALKQ